MPYFPGDYMGLEAVALALEVQDLQADFIEAVEALSGPTFIADIADELPADTIHPLIGEFVSSIDLLPGPTSVDDTATNIIPTDFGDWIL